MKSHFLMKIRKYLPIILGGVLVLFFVFYYGCRKREPHWEPASFDLPTRWSSSITPENAWQEYPRPIAVRKDWLNLNGLWDYCITRADAKKPGRWEGKILVPFPVESALSGVKRMVSDSNLIWYQKMVHIPASWAGKRIFLRFEAVDWKTTVWIDDFEVGTHQGGYDPFNFEITKFVKPGGKHKILVSVWDPTDKGEQPRGKQVTHPGGIFYTPSSGIWQTVWLEPVNTTFIQLMRIIPDVDSSELHLTCMVNSFVEGDSVKATVSLKGNHIATLKGSIHGLTISLPGAELWSPAHPVLYDMNVQLLRNGSMMDEVNTYFGMRKVSLGKDAQGFTRMMLNNQFLFQNGPLDQGFWPDGLYTPPSDEAMRHDLEMIKTIGFNMLRKHVKIEPRRFYYWCDRLGILVWQDMPSTSGFIGGDDPDLTVSQDHARQFEFELEQLIKTRFNDPCIIVWVPFNEGWGQYSTAKVVDIIKRNDPTRLVNAASGWTDRGVGDILDIHHYPDPQMPVPEEKRAIVLGEFGGLGLAVQNHTWQKENWGYRKMTDPEQLLLRYEEYYARVWDFINAGLSASVYTQITDVETETNGLMCYDREVLKMDTLWLAMANQGYLPPFPVSNQRIFLDKMEVSFHKPPAGGMIFYTLDGSEPTLRSDRYIAPIEISKNATVTARVIWPDGPKSRIRSFSFAKTSPFPALTTSGVQNGLKVDVYEGTWTSVPSFDSITPVKSMIVSSVTDAHSSRPDYTGLHFTGFISVPSTALYAFYLTSDDGSRLVMDNQTLIDNDGVHGMEEIKAFVALEKGLHKMEIAFFQGTGDRGLRLEMEGPSYPRAEVRPGMLFH
jgi:hypothetical protein